MKSNSKFFVKPLHDMLVSSEEFTVSSSGSSSGVRFDHHVAIILEKGEVTLSDFLRDHQDQLSYPEILFIINCLIKMVMDSHALDHVLMDIKDQNVMQFKMGRGLYSWKGIDLDSSLKEDTLLSESSFMATIRFMAPELLTGAVTRARLSLDIWSLGVLIFTILNCKHHQTFWSLLGIYSDAAIKEEVRRGRLTQKRIDELIERTFSGNDRSSQRHFLKNMLKIEPSERCTINALHDAALLKGASSISGSILYEGQKKILSEVKSLQELIKTELVPVNAALQKLLEDDTDLSHVNASLKDLQTLLVAQAQSTSDCKAAIQKLTGWKNSATTAAEGAAAIPFALSNFMKTVMIQLQEILTTADNNKKADATERKEFLLQLSKEVLSVQQQVQKAGDDVAALHKNFTMFGEYVRKELQSNSKNHAELLTVIGINRRLLSTLVNDTHSVPTLVVLVPILKTGFMKFDPRNLYREECRLFFFCEYSFKLVGGPKGKGYKLSTLLPWVKNALPIFKVGLMLLQVGLLAAGLPIPLAGLADTVLGHSDRINLLESAAGLLQSQLPVDSLGSALDSAASKEKFTAAIRNLQASQNLSDIRCAYEAIWAFLKEVDPTLLNLGMSKVTSPSGKVAWIEKNPDTIKHFMEHDGVFPLL